MHHSVLEFRLRFIDSSVVYTMDSRCKIIFLFHFSCLQRKIYDISNTYLRGILFFNCYLHYIVTLLRVKDIKPQANSTKQIIFLLKNVENKYHAFSRQSLFILLCFLLITSIVKKLCCRFMLPKSSLSFIACDNRNKKDRGCNLYSKLLIAIANDFIHGKIISL